jgi:hypothetical protein
MKIGRNDPCRCGSGKKYKHCCLHQPPDPQELLWRRVRRAIEATQARLLHCAREEYGGMAMVEAWDEFSGWLESGPDEPFEDPNFQLFTSWFFYEWTPDPVATDTLPGAPRDTQVAARYLAMRRAKLDPLERAYVEACLASHFSFYEVVSIRPAQGLTLRDVFTGAITHVLEKAMTETLTVDDVLFARLVPVGTITLIDSSGPYAFSPLEKAPLLEFRKRLKSRADPITPELLEDFTSELFDLYRMLFERVAFPQAPELQNTDGEPLEFQTVRYEIDTPQRAFDALHDLAAPETPEELLREAELDPNGALERVTFDWVKVSDDAGLGSTVLARIRIDGRLLTAEVNSAGRADRFKALIAERLGPAARFQATVVQSAERMLEHLPDRAESERSARAQQELMENPEVRAQVENLLRRQYANWKHESIPALGNRTPIEAMQDAEGREMVESLLAYYERGFAEQFPWMAESPIAAMRKDIGL